MKLITAVSAMLLLVTSIGFAQSTWHVPDDFASIQGAISHASVVNGDTIIVRPGTYAENIQFKGKAILVRSEQGPSSTVIDGHQIDSVVKFINGEGLDSIIEGFTIRNGTSLSGCGIRCEQSSPTIRYNVITENIRSNIHTDGYGGGIYSGKGSPNIHDNLISKNNIFSLFGVAYGGGIFCSVGSPVVRRNRIIENSGGTWGGGIFCNDTARVEGNTIAGNNAHYGSGIYVSGYSEIIGNIIEFNDAYPTTTYGYGGGIMAAGYSPTIEGNIIRSNNTLLYGGGILCTNTIDARITNNTILENTTDSMLSVGGGGIYLGGGANATAANNIIRGNWANNGKQIYLHGNYGPDMLTIHHSCVEGGQPDIFVGPDCTLIFASGMIDADPLFADIAAGDLHLSYPSPCRDTGDKGAVTELHDHEGDPRIAWGGTVDMGADEFHTHLYVTGDKTPGGSIVGKFVGLPDTDPLGLFFGSGILAQPVQTMWGPFHLQSPWFLIPLLPLKIPSDGILALPSTVPASIPAPYDVPMQALIGLNSDSLSNLSVLEVR